MNPERYTLLLTSNLDENDPQTLQIAGGDDLKSVTLRAEAILLAIAGHNEYAHCATYSIAIRDNETGEATDPKF